MALGHTHAVVGLGLPMWLLLVLARACREESFVCTMVPEADSSEGTKGSMLVDCWKLVAVLSWVWSYVFILMVSMVADS